MKFSKEMKESRFDITWWMLDLRTDIELMQNYKRWEVNTTVCSLIRWMKWLQLIVGITWHMKKMITSLNDNHPIYSEGT